MRTNRITIVDGRKRVSLKGRSVKVEVIPIYSSDKDVPLIEFKPSGIRYPLFPRGTYENPDGEFNSIEIIGTPESNGDFVRLVSSPECWGTDFNINFTSTEKVVVGDTTDVTLSGGSLFSFSTSHKTNDEGDFASNCELYVIQSDIWVAFGATDPDPANNIGKRLYAGEHYRIQGQDRIDTATFIQADSTVDSILNFDMDF